MAWQPIAANTELRALADRLRAAGFPASAIRAVLFSVINERRSAANPLIRLPYWQRRNPPKEFNEMLQAQFKETQPLLESALGPDAAPSASLDPLLRDNLYGHLSSDKIDAISKLDRDYGEMMQSLYPRNRPLTGEEMQAINAQRQLLEKEKRKDLAALLSPEDLAEYDLHNSQAANRVMGSLRDVTLSEPEYRSLVRLQQSFDDKNPMPMGSPFTPAMAVDRNLAQQALNEEVRSVLGDDRFLRYLQFNDPMFGALVQNLSRLSGVPVATAYQVYQLQSEVQTVVVRSSLGAGGGAQQPPDLSSYNARLDALLGTSNADAYRKMPGNGQLFVQRPPTIFGPVKPPGG